MDWCVAIETSDEDFIFDGSQELREAPEWSLWRWCERGDGYWRRVSPDGLTYAQAMELARKRGYAGTPVGG